MLKSCFRRNSDVTFFGILMNNSDLANQNIILLGKTHVLAIKGTSLHGNQ